MKNPRTKYLLTALVVPLALLVVLCLPGSANAQRWTDLPPQVLADYSITENQVSLISQGYLDNTWRPYQPMTRAQFVKLAVDRFELRLIEPARANFNDVGTGHQYFDYIETARVNGMVQGRADGSFGPFETVTRAQAAAIIVRFMAQLEGTPLGELYGPSEIDAILEPFAETPAQIGALAVEVAAAVDRGILRGTSDRRLNPFQELLRIQGAAILLRAEIPPTQDVEMMVYFARDGGVASAARLVKVGPGLQVAAATLVQMFAGPSRTEHQLGVTTEIPPATTLRGLAIQAGVATVDLSQHFAASGTAASMEMRLAQVVYALTQFPTVDSVRFRVEGQALTELGGIPLEPPLTRPTGVDEPLEAVTPAIFVESPPLSAGVITGPVRVTGTANVFEATFLLEVWDDEDNLLAKEIVTATAGTGTRGTFDVTVPFTTPQTATGRVVAYWESAVDGSPQDVVVIPVVFEDH